MRTEGEGVPGLPPLRLGDALEPGTVLGDYELVRRLGMGGMGVVFEARQRNVLGRRVALKVLRSPFETEELSRRFKREVAAVAELDHPSIVPVVDARVEGGTPYYVMKFVEGVSAAGLVRELKNGARVPLECASVRRFVERCARPSAEDQPQGREGSSSGPESSWEESYAGWIARIGLQLAEALQYAHEHGFVHRDVKPANVLLTPQGRAVLVDFGLVAVAGDESLTRTREFLGTLGYASPEQLRGEAPDARSDVYSLGATLYELLALARPFGDCAHSELVRRVEHDDPAPLGKELPLDLRTIVGTSLARAPGQRYASAGAMAADLRAFLAGQPIRARPPGWVQRAVRVMRRHPRLVAAAVGVLAALGGLRAVAQRRAAELVARGSARLGAALAERQELDRLLVEHERALGQRPRDHERLMALRADIETGRERASAGLREARSILVQAFEHVAGNGAAHAELARVAAEGLRQALGDARDVLFPGSLSELEEELARHDSAGRFAHLRERVGWVSLASVPTGARVTIEGRKEPLRRTTPIERLELPEGSYVARLEAPGRAPTRLPFLVRRAAAYEDERARPARELAVVLPRSDEAPDGFVVIPAGETLVDDDPPRWEHVRSFWIGRHELAWRELAALANAREAELGVELDFAPGLPLRRSTSGEWEIRGANPEWPVKGATPMEMFAWTSWLDGRIARAPPEWVPALPTRAEWVRAARGADGRPYPWGWEFDGEKCANYVWGPDYGRDADPVPIGSVPADVSPFGVLDLAGSAAEITQDLHEPRPGEYVACGGSYWCDDPDDFRVTALREDENDRPRQDVGLRIVLREPPEALRWEPGPPEPFRDDFERPDSAEVGNGWLEFASNPFDIRTDPHALERCSIEDGRLVLGGGQGNFSEASSAWHPLRVPESGCTVRARIRAFRDPSASADVAGGRSFGLALCRELRASRCELVALTLSFDGESQLALVSSSGTQALARGSGLDVGVELDFELACRPERYEARIWPAGGERRAWPLLALERPVGWGMPRFLGFMVPNAVGARVEVAETEVALE
jgi:formylglycine-generating enzyme required for sulfatase activity